MNLGTLVQKFSSGNDVMELTNLEDGWGGVLVSNLVGAGTEGIFPF